MELTQKDVKEILDYNPDTGELIWKKRDLSLFAEEAKGKTWNARFAGKPAYNVSKSKSGFLRWNVVIWGKTYLAHRVIWLYMTGEWPKYEIDHKDRDATNNKWDNLRQVQTRQNGKNKSMNKRNTSGVTGVYWKTNKSRWLAKVTLDGVTHHLGSYAREDLDIAAMEVMEFRAENGFDPKHGMSFAHYHNM